MEAERWRQVRDLFDSLCDESAASRETALEQVARDDPKLAGEVAELFADEAKIGSFLERPLMPEPQETEIQLSEPRAGSRLGSYLLERRIGEGGAGVVFLASRADDLYEQRVAIKILRPEVVSAETRRRFHRERQILALLDHPGIAKIMDGGTTEEGLPYVVLEYIEGEPIDRYCDGRNLSVAERLELVRKICSAVNLAHQNLIVHRDLKPSNILVTPEGQPKLLDFGIAKLISTGGEADGDQTTASWLRLLTPSYASPEQLQGQPVTTATDVYALGVVLFKLLSGRLPFDLRGMTAARDVELLICEQPVRRPTSVLSELDEGTLREIARNRDTRAESLRKQLVGDLDNIVLMALRKDPHRRYPSVLELREDLNRHLQSFPVFARADSLSYRWRKWLQRNRLVAAFSAACCILVLSWAFSATWLSKRVSRERDAKEETLSYLKGMFNLLDPAFKPGEQWTLRRVLDHGSASLAAEFPEQPEVRAELAGFFGRLQLGWGELEKARDLLNSSHEILQTLPGADPTEIIATMGSLGEVKRELGEYDEALELQRRTLALARETYGDHHPALVKPLNQLVAVHCYRDEFADAEAPATEALALARSVLAPDDSSHIEAVTNRALLHRKLNQLKLAEAGYKEALVLHRRIWQVPHPLVADITENLAAVFYAQKRFSEAEKHSREALAIRQAVLGRHHPSIAHSLSNLARSLTQQSRYAEAETALRQVIEILSFHADESHPRLVSTFRRLATLQLMAGLPEAVEPILAQRIELWRHQRPLGDAEVLRAEGVLVDALVRLGRSDEAKKLLETWLEELPSELDAEHPAVVEIQQRLASLQATRR